MISFMRRMIILLLFVFWSCQNSIPVKKGKKFAPPKRVYSLSIFSPVGSWKSWEEIIRRINQERKYPISLKKEGEYRIYVERKGGGYYLRLYLHQFLVQTARALHSYEVPLAVTALIKSHIPDSLKSSSVPEL